MTDRQIHVAIALGAELCRVAKPHNVTTGAVHGCSWDDIRGAIEAGGTIQDFEFNGRMLRAVNFPGVSFIAAEPLPVPLVREEAAEP